MKAQEPGIVLAVHVLLTAVFVYALALAADWMGWLDFAGMP